jgi:hypothetical protein
MVQAMTAAEGATWQQFARSRLSMLAARFLLFFFLIMTTDVYKEPIVTIIFTTIYFETKGGEAYYHCPLSP